MEQPRSLGFSRCARCALSVVSGFGWWFGNVSLRLVRKWWWMGMYGVLEGRGEAKERCFWDECG